MQRFQSNSPVQMRRKSGQKDKVIRRHPKIQQAGLAESYLKEWSGLSESSRHLNLGKSAGKGLSRTYEALSGALCSVWSGPKLISIYLQACLGKLLEYRAKGITIRSKTA